MLPWLAVWTSLLLILSGRSMDLDKHSLEGSLDPRSARLSAVSRPRGAVGIAALLCR